MAEHLMQPGIFSNILFIAWRNEVHSFKGLKREEGAVTCQ